MFVLMACVLCCCCSDLPVLLGAPTGKIEARFIFHWLLVLIARNSSFYAGSGKTTVAELALLRMKKRTPQSKCVYIAPLKSLARERLKEWTKRLGSDPLNWKVLELSGDTSHDSYALNNSDVLICTVSVSSVLLTFLTLFLSISIDLFISFLLQPEKWDLISRGWRGVSHDFTSSSASNGKQFVRQVGLLIIDEIHLLGEERGAVLEAIVSRTRFISQCVRAEAHHQPERETKPEATRIMGLSTALANPYGKSVIISFSVSDVLLSS